MYIVGILLIGGNHLHDARKMRVFWDYFDSKVFLNFIPRLINLITYKLKTYRLWMCGQVY